MTRPALHEQLALTVFVGAAIGGFAFARQSGAAWLLLLPCAVSPFWRIELIPERLRAWTRNVAWTCLGGTVVLGLVFTAYPVLSTESAALFTLLAGYSLANYATLFLLGTPVWVPSSTLFPTTIGTLVVSAFNPEAHLQGFLALAGVGTFFYLVVGSQTGTTHRTTGSSVQGKVVRLVFSALATGLIAWAIIGFLPWAQARVEQATVTFLSSQSTEYPSFSLQSRLGDIAELKLSTKVVLRLWSSRPQKLRGRVFTRFDGQTWHAPGFAGSTLSPATEGDPPSGPVAEWWTTVPGNLFLVPGNDPTATGQSGMIRTKIVQTVFNNGMMVSPAQKLLVRVSLPQLRIDPFENLTVPLSSSIRIYGVINRWDSEVVQSEAPTPEMTQELLALPEDTDPRWKELAAQLATQFPSAEERVPNTVAYVQSAARYSLTVGEFHSRQPVTEFFFEKKQGYCQYFASAACILLRLQGVACRYVIGFNVQEWNRPGGHFVVREADAHAWIEAYVPGKGWVMADPTPEAEFQARRENAQQGWFSETTEWLTAELTELSIRLRESDWREAGRWIWGKIQSFLRTVFVENLVVVLLLTVLIVISITWVRRQRRSVRDRRTQRIRHELLSQIPPELEELIHRLERLWASRGVARPAWRGPLEHLESIPPEKFPPALREASRRVVECFYRVSFGGARVTTDEIRELESGVARASQG